MEYQITHIKFSPEPDSDEMRILKLSKTFHVDEDRAKEILEQIESDKPVIFDYSVGGAPGSSWGVNFHSESLENLKRKQDNKKEEEERKKEFKALVVNADEWYDSLSKEHKEFADALIIDRRSAVYAVG